MRKMLERRGGDEGNENYLIPERANIRGMKRSLDAALVFFFCLEGQVSHWPLF